MAVPKQRKSRRRTRNRRAQFKTSAPTYATCSRCHEPVRPHHVCANCGHYKGRIAVEVD